MDGDDKAIAIWRELSSIPASVHRVRNRAAGEPMTFGVHVPAKALSGKHISELLNIADAHKVAVGVTVVEGDPVIVLS